LGRPLSHAALHQLIVNDAYTNCSFMSFSGGWTPGTAPHIIDLPIWALDLDYSTVTYSSGGRYTIHDAGDSPDTQEIVYAINASQNHARLLSPPPPKKVQSVAEKTGQYLRLQQKIRKMQRL
jgi:hypothetical protein